MNLNSLYPFYRQHIEEQLIPFWKRALDHQNGGVFTCFSNTGNRLLSRDKYTWSQGRFLWLWTKIAAGISENKLEGEAGDYIDHIHKTAGFLEDNVFLKNGNCAFLLNEKGEMKESMPGRGFDTSIYADCFVVTGFAACAGFLHNKKMFARAVELYQRIRERIQTANYRSDPYPVPAGYRPHSIPMIMLNISQELAGAAKKLNHSAISELNQQSLAYMKDILDCFCMEDHTIIEMLPDDDRSRTDTLLVRHLNPGHAIESMWFVMHAAQTASDSDNASYIHKAARVIERAIETGWDSNYGGLFRFVDREGGKPTGKSTSSLYEQMITDTWDMKLWWPHSEALYATLLAYYLTADENMLRLHEKIREYTFRIFPNPDKAIGEWIQIRDRQGIALDRIAALPVKDPFHILRSLLLILDLREEQVKMKTFN